MLLNVFGFVGDHTDERVELQDGDAQVDDVYWISKETLQCWHKVCMGKFMNTTYNIGFSSFYTL